MKRPTQAILAVLILVTGMAAAQTLQMIEGAIEVDLRTVTLPDSTGGMLIFRLCESCAPQSLRTTSATTFSTSSGQLSLADFRQRVAQLLSATPTIEWKTVGVFYSLESGYVTRVVLSDEDQ